jgi:AraC family transcriptional regulator
MNEPPDVHVPAVRYDGLSEEGVLRLLLGWRAAVRRKLTLRGLWAWDIRLPPGFRAPAHEHALPFFCILLDGALEYRTRHGAIELRPLVNVFYPAGTVHSAVAGGRGARIVTLEASPEWIRRAEDYLLVPEVPTPLELEDGAFAAGRLLRELDAPEPCSQLAVEGLALELLAAASRAARPGSDAACRQRTTPSWVRRAEEQLHERFHEPITLQAVAASLNVTPTRLGSDFRRHTGMGFGEALRRVRVDYVKRRLGGDAVSLADLAADAGFADQAHCTRVFKSITGCTPGRLRRSLLHESAGLRA